MSTHAGPNIIESGLVLSLDAANEKSYPLSGTTWYDLSGNGNHGTLTSSPTFSTDGNGAMQFDGTSYVDVPSPNLAASDFTVIGASRYTGATKARIITSKVNNWLLGHWSSNTEVFYSEGWVRGSTGGVSNEDWRIYAGSGNISLDQYSFWVNGSKLTNNSVVGAAGPNGFALGRWKGTSEGSTGQVGFLLVYNRVLTDAEILQNYNAMRVRYGI
jgi:hypothetical protein